MDASTLEGRLAALPTDADQMQLCGVTPMWFAPTHGWAAALPDTLAARVLSCLPARDLVNLVLSCGAFAAAVAQLEDAGLLNVRPPLAPLCGRVEMHTPSFCCDGSAYIWDNDTLVRVTPGITRVAREAVAQAPEGLPGTMMLCGRQLHFVGLDSRNRLVAWRLQPGGEAVRVATGNSVRTCTMMLNAHSDGGDGFIIAMRKFGRSGGDSVYHLNPSGSRVSMETQDVFYISSSSGSALLAAYDKDNSGGYELPPTFIFDAADLRARKRAVRLLDNSLTDQTNLAAMVFYRGEVDEQDVNQLLVEFSTYQGLGIDFWINIVTVVSDQHTPLFHAFLGQTMFRVEMWTLSTDEDDTDVWGMYEVVSPHHRDWHICHAWLPGEGRRRQPVAMHAVDADSLLLVLADGTLQLLRRALPRWEVQREVATHTDMSGWTQYQAAVGGSIVMRDGGGALRLVGFS